MFEHNFNTIDPYKRKPNEWLITTPRNYASHDSAHYIQQGAIEFLCLKSVKCIYYCEIFTRWSSDHHHNQKLSCYFHNWSVWWQFFCVRLIKNIADVCFRLHSIFTFGTFHLAVNILCVWVWPMQVRINLNFVCFYFHLHWLAGLPLIYL